MAPKVIIGGLSHETNAFCQRPTRLEDFRRRCLLFGEEIPRVASGTNTEMGGFLQALEAHGWEPVFTALAAAVPSGKVEAEAEAAATGPILAAIEATPDRAGVLLELHGAMVSEVNDDAEGALLEAVRDRVGPDLPVIATLDLHANVTDRMAANASALISYRTYPHVDLAERGREAGDLLEASMAGRVRPTTVVARRALLSGCNDGRTDAGPMLPLLARARAFEQEPGVLSVSINAGFPDSDMFDAGPSVTVTGDGPSPRWREIAEVMMDDIWERRDEKTVTYLGPAEAVCQAKAALAGAGPAVIADYADNPGSGAYGDATGLLAEMLDADLENAAFGGICDPEAAGIMTQAGQGAEVTLALGGKTDPRFGGGPLALTGAVQNLSDGTFSYGGPMFTGMPGQLGPTAVLRCGGLDILVISHNCQMLDLELFRAGGIEPTDKTFLGVKSMQHFLGAFGPIASAIFICDSGALSSPDYRTRPFKNLRRPVHPLDPLEECIAAMT